jgi:hypothetical protein
MVKIAIAPQALIWSAAVLPPLLRSSLISSFSNIGQRGHANAAKKR